MATRFIVNQPRFVDETIGGEALVMDMVRGSYYSCLGTAAAAWNALKAGATAEEIAPRLGDTGADGDQVDRDLEAFVADLLTNELLVPRPEGNEPDAAALAAVEWPAAYEAPVLERYTDLADLILLDPVHDVSEDGWPRTAG